MSKKIIGAATLLIACSALAGGLRNMDNPKISKLIGQMTLEEKVHQLATQYPNANARLKIPNLTANECLHGLKMDGATVFPQAIAMGATWDEELIEKIGNVVAKESRAYGIHQCYTPMIAVVRDARWGRTEEGYGEDPWLVGKIGAAYIRGLQGTGEQRFDKDHIFATAKHYVADGEPMAGDNGAAMDISMYNLNNIHMMPFKMAIEEAGVAAIMPAHHLMNGIPCHGNKNILNDMLRDAYGWDGLIVSDNGDIKAMYSGFQYAQSPAEAARMALECGIHQELALFNGWSKGRMYGDTLIKGVQNGIVPIDIVDNAVAHVLQAKFDLDLFGKPIDERFDVILNPKMGEPAKVKAEDIEIFAKALYVGIPRPGYQDVLNDPAHNELAREVARKAITLLKNKNNLLPLDPKKLKNVAVIGPNAVEQRIGGYSPDKPKYYVSPLDGIRKYLGGGVNVEYAKGCHLFKQDLSGIAEAVKLAAKSDVTILVMGGSEETCRENQDTDTLDLLGNQKELVQAVAATGKPYVVMLLNGRPQSINWCAKHAPAILEGWYMGQDTGTVIAETLFGDNNPGGKLPMSFARNAGQLPLFYNKLKNGRNRNLFESDERPLYPFGYGLSYTTFNISAPRLSTSKMTADGKTTLSVNVTNTGDRAGDEVIQLYIRDIHSKRVRPRKELRGFKRISLKPGESKTVAFEIGFDQLQYWVDGEWTVEPGDFTIMVGPNSRDLQKTKLSVK